MSDDPDDSAGAAPDDDAHIRALLAELGSGPDGESMPPEVAARLDDTLARLLAERAPSAETTSPQESGVVVPLRRRWAARVTAAAAAVIVLAGGGVAATHLGVFGGSSGESQSSSAGGSTAGDSEALAPTPAAPGALSRKGSEQAGVLPRVRSSSFAADAAAAVRSVADQGTEKAQTSTPAPAVGALGCTGPRVTDAATLVPIVFDGHHAVLVVHPVSHGTQLVEAWSCRGEERLDRATITP